MPKAGTSRKRLKELKIQLEEAMVSKNYRLVDSILSEHPNLIYKRDKNCENLLIKAIRLWDPALVNIFMKYGCDPHEKHQCSKDSRVKNAVLVATEELHEKTKDDQNKGFHANYQVYTKILQELVCCESFNESS